MRRDELQELQNIVRRGNLESILQRGVLSHQLAQSVAHESVADPSVQERRSSIVVPPSRRRLHSYANLYFNARNIMMFRVQYDNGWDDSQLCVLGLSLDVLDLPGVIITDRNAAGWPWWKTPEEALPLLDHATIFAPRWDHADERLKRDHQQRMCAEILVPDCVDPELITRVYVPTHSCVTTTEGICNGAVPVEVKGRLFFRS